MKANTQAQPRTFESEEPIQAMPRPLSVFMMDLVSIVPYYVGHLCRALSTQPAVNVQVGAITYHLDRNYFCSEGLSNDPGMLDLVSRTSLPPFLRRVCKVVECLANLCALAIRFQFSRPDIIHVQFLALVNYGLPVELWLLANLRRRGTRVVYTVHNVLPHDGGEGRRQLYHRIYSLANRLICHSADARSRLVEEFGVAPASIDVIAHGPLFGGCPRRQPQQAREKLGIDRDEALVLWQGIIRPYKGVPFLLETWRQLTRGGTKALLILAGGGEEEQIRLVKSQVQELGIAGSVRLELRFVSVEELDLYYSAADVLVYPYSSITTSGALMTGLRYGKAIVATRLKAFDGLLRDGENSLLVDYGDPTQFAAALRQLMVDSPLRQRLGNGARRLFDEGPDWGDIASETISSYEAAMAMAGKERFRP